MLSRFEFSSSATAAQCSREIGYLFSVTGFQIDDAEEENSNAESTIVRASILLGDFRVMFLVLAFTGLPATISPLSLIRRSLPYTWSHTRKGPNISSQPRFIV